MKKIPTDAQMRLWLSRMARERKAGSPPEVAIQIVSEMIASWIAVAEGETSDRKIGTSKIEPTP